MSKEILLILLAILLAWELIQFLKSRRFRNFIARFKTASFAFQTQNDEAKK
jgi:hypothetical protein